MPLSALLTSLLPGNLAGRLSTQMVMEHFSENLELKKLTLYSGDTDSVAEQGHEGRGAAWVYMEQDQHGTHAIVGQSSARRDSLWKRTSLLFISLWLITLISLITTLGLYSLQRSALQTRILELQTETSGKLSHSEVTQSLLRKQLDEKEQEFSQLQTRYNSEICFSSDTNRTVKDVLSEWSRKDGVVPKPVWKWMHEAAVDVTLDPDTAASWLNLTEDRKQVTYTEKPKRVSDSWKRFNIAVCVLGKEGLLSGRCYYEVQVGEKTEWTLGVAKQSINRKGRITLNPGNGYWTVSLRNGTEYRAVASPSVLLPLREKPRTVGVYVDYEGGQVSFYNVEARSHIYSFTGYTFTRALLPFFYPGMTKAPLIISPVSHI